MTFHLGLIKVHSTSLIYLKCLLDECKHDDLFHILLFVGAKTPNFHKAVVVLSVFGEFIIVKNNMFSCINYRDSVKEMFFELWMKDELRKWSSPLLDKFLNHWDCSASVRIISSNHKNSVFLCPLWTALSLSSPLASQEVVGARNKLTISHCIICHITALASTTVQK